MGKRYHCDVCEKSFKSDSRSIKKHLTSLMHQRAQKEHYANFRDAETILNEESQKVTCSKFRYNGECQFGVLCRFSHYSPHQLQTLRHQVEDERRRKLAENSLSDWLQKRSNKCPPRALLPVSGAESEDKVLWSAPQSVSIHPHLPPSLQPVTVAAFHNFQPQSWG